MRFRRSMAFLFAFVLTAVGALAQTETGRISGTVTDSQGAVVPGVTVNATSVGTGVVRSTVTDATGRYVIPNVPRVHLRRQLRAVRLQGGEDQGHRVRSAATTAADAKLEVGNVSEQVNVTAAPETVNTRTPQFQTTITSQQLVELPTLTRNPYDLVAIAGNVHDVNADEVSLVGGVGRGTGFSINGARSASTNILLDGGDNNNQFDTSVGQEVPLDAVQEFSVITNNYSAQYGRATGGIVNLITKSGTNIFTGTAYEFFRNEKMSNNTPDNEANGIAKGPFKRNQTGYSFGGPIVKDKVHFFSSLEYIGVRGTDTLITWVPTARVPRGEQSRDARVLRRLRQGRDDQRTGADARRGVRDCRRRCRRVQLTAGEPADLRPRRSAAGGRDRRRVSPGRLPADREGRFLARPEHAGVDPLCLSEQGDGTGHAVGQPVRRCTTPARRTRITTSTDR